VTALTALLESIAMIVDHHQPVVEKYYGADKMAIVIRRLLDECDRVVRSTLDGWKEDRSIKRKVEYLVLFDGMMILRPLPHSSWTCLALLSLSRLSFLASNHYRSPPKKRMTRTLVR
jgi:hypothetical protein